jgi:Tol biopolymer transport system component
MLRCRGLVVSSKRAFRISIILTGLAVLNLSADGTKNRGERVLIKNSGTLFLMDPAGSQRKIADDVRVGSLSPDGSLVAYADDKGVYVFDLLGSQRVTLARLTEGRGEGLVWSPDQKFLAYDVVVRRKSWDLYLASYPPHGDAPRNLGHWYETINFSPDGKFIVHPTLETSSGARSNLETVSVETGKRETIYEATDVIWDAQYAPDGSRIAFLMTRTEPGEGDDDGDCRGPDRDLWILPLASKRPQKIIDNVFAFDWSADGRFLAIDKGTQDCGYPPGDGAVFISSSDGKVQFQLSKDAPSMGAKFSPDAKQVMFIEFNGSRLVIGDLEKRKLTPLSSPSGGGNYVVYGWK